MCHGEEKEGSEWKWGLRTKEDSSEVRQEGILENQRGGGSNSHANLSFVANYAVCCFNLLGMCDCSLLKINFISICKVFFLCLLPPDKFIQCYVHCI